MSPLVLAYSRSVVLLGVPKTSARITTAPTTANEAACSTFGAAPSMVQKLLSQVYPVRQSLVTRHGSLSEVIVRHFPGEHR